MRYGSIPPYGSNIVNPSIPIKPRLCARFGSTMMKNAFMSSPTKVRLRERQNMYRRKYRHKDGPNSTDRQTIGHRDHTSNWIGI